MKTMSDGSTAANAPAASIPSEPALLRGVAEAWPARRRWTWAFFKQMQEVPLTLSNADAEPQQKTTVSRYVEAILSGESNPYGALYGSGWRFFEHFPEMLADFSEPECVRGDVLQQVPRQVFNPLLWLFLGGEGSGSALHQDVLSTHAWLAVLAGRKRFALHPPADWSSVFEARQGEAAEVLRQRCAHGSWRYLELNAGDLIFIPSGWWHVVINEGPTIGLTRNVATPDILPHVIRAAQAHKLHKLLPWLTSHAQPRPCPSTSTVHT